MGDSLRDRLAGALADPGHCTHPGADSCDQWWRADAAMEVVAAWLREQSDQNRKFAYDRPGNDHLLTVAAELDGLADAITASKDDGDG